MADFRGNQGRLLLLERGSLRGVLGRKRGYNSIFGRLTHLWSPRATCGEPRADLVDQCVSMVMSSGGAERSSETVDCVRLDEAGVLKNLSIRPTLSPLDPYTPRHRYVSSLLSQRNQNFTIFLLAQKTWSHPPHIHVPPLTYFWQRTRSPTSRTRSSGWSTSPPVGVTTCSSSGPPWTGGAPSSPPRSTPTTTASSGGSSTPSRCVCVCVRVHVQRVYVQEQGVPLGACACMSAVCFIRASSGCSRCVFVLLS